MTTANSNQSYPRNFWETLPIVYKWHTENVICVGQLYDLPEFRLLFNSINIKIISAIKVHHGVQHGTPNSAPTNRHDTFILHFADVLIYTMTEIESKPLPNAIIMTQSFNQVLNEMINSLFMNLDGNQDSSFTNEEKLFVQRNTNIYHQIHSNWHVYSNKLIWFEM